MIFLIKNRILCKKKKKIVKNNSIQNYEKFIVKTAKNHIFVG